MLQFAKGFIMLCDIQTEEECLRRNLFGDKAKKFQSLCEIKSGDVGLLLNISTDELIGIFQATSEPKLHIEPDAWNRRFAAQVRVKLIGKLQRIKDATYILKKAGVSLVQLKSGIPAPRHPVQLKEVMEKIITFFGEHNKKTPTKIGQ